MSTNIRTAVIAVVISALMGAGGAVAATQITSKNVKDHSLYCRDLSNGLNAAIPQCHGAGPVAGPAGERGTNGVNGQPGGKGDTGATGATGPQGKPGDSSVVHVTKLVDDTGTGIGVHAFAKRGGTCDDLAVNPDAPLGIAVLRLGHLVLGGANGGFGDGLAYAGVANSDLNGWRLKDIETLAYSEMAVGGVDGYNAAYLKLVVEGNRSVVFSPSTQPGGPGSSKGFRRHVVTDGTVRYDDDTGNAPDVTWAQLIADHGDDVVVGLRIFAGCAGDYSDGSVANVDNLLIKAGGEQTRYDFDNAPS